MSIYFEKDDVVLFHGENPSQLLELPDSFVETIITDPPYGLSFMGKKWDYDVPSIEIWKECLRILKPGGTALIFAGSRTQHRMAVNVEDAGFILKDCIMWLYGSGFPKATDISKQLDKMAGAEREVVGISKYQIGKYKKDSSQWVGNKGIYRDDIQLEAMVTVPATPEAILWNGWKSHGLKPAYEPILVAMKPNEGTYANNALVHGVSGLNIEGGRIVHNEPVKTTIRTAKRTGTSLVMNTGKSDKWQEGTIASPDSKGRFPANIILDEEAGRMLDEQSGISKSTGGSGKASMKTAPNDVYGTYKEGHKSANLGGLGDKGGASRFFYCAKASKKERNAGCEELEIKPCKTMSEREPDANGSHNTTGQKPAMRQNHHPTVKPLALMKYLCTLTATPTGGTIFDPFMGSGTTGVASKILGRPFIGIDQEESSCEIAKARIIHATGEEK